MKIGNRVGAFTYLPNKAVLVGIFFKINKNVYTFIRQTRVGI